MKKFIAVLLTALLLLSLLTTLAFAEEVAPPKQVDIQVITDELPEEELISVEEPSVETLPNDTTVAEDEQPTIVEENLSDENVDEYDDSSDTEAISYDSLRVEVNETNFPGEKFREYIRSNYSKNGYTSPYALANTKELYIANYGFTNLKGIEYFTELELLDCSNNKIGTLDISKNQKLVDLRCTGCELSSLDVSANAALKSLSCGGNNLSSIDISKNAELLSFGCSNNNISSIDVSKNAKLRLLNCSGNKISSLDVSKNANLGTLYCCYNFLTELDLSNNKYMNTLWCDNNYISSLKLIDTGRWYEINCTENKLTKLDLASFTTLEKTLSFTQSTTTSEKFKHVDGKWQINLSNIIAPEDRDKIYQGNNAGYTFDTTTGIATVESEKEPEKIKYFYDTKFPGTMFSNRYLDVTVETGVDKPVDATKIEQFVERLYTTALGRASESEGKKAWVDYLTAGKETGAGAGKAFMLSKEFENRNLSDDEFLNVVYQTYFGRSPDTAGYNAWMKYLVNGYSREGVICAFAVSKEFQAICDSYGMERGTITSSQNRDKNATLTSFVNRIYTKLLDRTAEEKGLNDWTGAILKGDFTVKQTAVIFVESKEFLAHNYSTEDYVTHLYRMFFGREPEKAGFDNWVKYINDGKCTRTQAAEAFADGPEFAAIMKDAGV